MTKQHQFTALGTYIFAGGFTLGVRDHLKVLAHFEDGPYGTATFQKNQPGIPIFIEPDRWPVKDYRGKVNFVYSNPPCAPWSAASVSRKLAWQDDPRVSCVHRSFSLLDALRPDVWAWESVGRTFNKGKELRDALTVKAAKLGYSVTHLLVEGSRLGLPQRRNRYFMLAHKIQLEFEEPRFSEVTVRQALRGVKPDQHPGLGFVEKIVKHIEQGGEGREVFERKFGKRAKTITLSTGRTRVQGRPSFQLRRLAWDAPSFTLTGGAQMIHPVDDRYLSVAEYAALCGYPKGYEFLGTLSTRYAQVAQCVTPPVGRWLAGEVRRNLETGERLRGKPTERVVDLRRDPMTITQP
jgi:DNA (cytosine-5)-methyltransferase 1